MLKLLMILMLILNYYYEAKSNVDKSYLNDPYEYENLVTKKVNNEIFEDQHDDEEVEFIESEDTEKTEEDIENNESDVLVFVSNESFGVKKSNKKHNYNYPCSTYY